MIIFLLETAGAGEAAEANFVMGPIIRSILIELAVLCIVYEKL